MVVDLFLFILKISYPKQAMLTMISILLLSYLQSSEIPRQPNTYFTQFEGYHLHINMSSFYSQAIKSLPKYRRDQSCPPECDSNYVQGSTIDIPCSPRLVQRSNNQRQVVTRMLKSYPQPDGSYVCHVKQGAEHNIGCDIPPPLPTKQRDHQYPKVTIQVPYKRSHSTAEISNGSQQPLYQSANQQRARSISHQPNDLYSTNNHRPAPAAYKRTNSYPTQYSNSIPVPPLSSSSSHNTAARQRNSTLIISTQNAQPLLLHQDNALPLHTSNGVGLEYTAAADTSIISGHQRTRLKGAPLHHAKSQYLERVLHPYESRSNSLTSQTSSSTFTGSMEATKRCQSESPESNRRSKSRSSSLEDDIEADSDCSAAAPELYPEQRLVSPFRSPCEYIFIESSSCLELVL